MSNLVTSAKGRFYPMEAMLPGVVPITAWINVYKCFVLG